MRFLAVCLSFSILIRVDSPFDYSVKPARPHNQPVCPKNSDLAAAYARDVLLGRQVTQQEDYSCSETKPCSNG